MSQWFVVFILILFGLGLIVLELLFIPGTTLIGLIGLISSAFGIGLSYSYFGSTIGTAVLIGSLGVTVFTLYQSFRVGVWERFALKDVIDGKVNEEESLQTFMIDDEGVAVSDLRPMGTGEFRGVEREVQTMSGFVETGSKIKIIKLEQNKIWVEKVEQKQIELGKKDETVA